MRPVEGSWIIVDDAYGAQMAERARLIRERPAAVIAALPGSEAAQAELLEVALRDLPPGFARDRTDMRRPDGAVVELCGPHFEVLGRLLQEDLLLLERRKGRHVLTAGLLCFPASWTLVEKIGHPLDRIHGPVAEYGTDLALRVERLFARVPPGRALWRANALGYARPDLHQPRPEAAPRDMVAPARYLRSERQTVLRLPRTGAVLFAVHSWVVPFAALTEAQRRDCPVA